MQRFETPTANREEVKDTKTEDWLSLEERTRVEELKEKLRDDPSSLDLFKKRQITSPSSAVKELIRQFAVRRSRDRNLALIALNEYDREKKKTTEEEKIAHKQCEAEEQQAFEEQQALAQSMGDLREQHRQQRFKAQRVQERFERDINSHLLTIEELEAEALSGNPEVTKQRISFTEPSDSKSGSDIEDAEAAEITVYTLRGFPFSVLATRIDYRESDRNNAIGKKTYEKVMDSPAFWARRLDEAEKEPGFREAVPNGTADTISASMWGSEHYSIGFRRSNLIYGFERVDPDSIIMVRSEDADTQNSLGRAETQLSESDPINVEGLERSGREHGYNEVLMRRYDETGIPKKPSYIIAAKDGTISTESLRAAKYFGIPIVKIEWAVYDDKAYKEYFRRLESIDEADDYEDLIKVIESIQALSLPDSKPIQLITTIGRGADEFVATDYVSKKVSEIRKLELKKRLAFLKKTLEDATIEVELATKHGAHAPKIPPQFEEFWIHFNDESDNGKGHKYFEINFRLENSAQQIELTIIDGERPFSVAVAAAEERTGIKGDSSAYDALEPIARKYLSALRKNEEVLQS